MNPEEMAKHIMRMYDQADDKEAMTEAIAHAIRQHSKPLVKRLAELREIMSDIQYQFEQTKYGYYLYRFDVEAMHRIADAVGIEPAGEGVPFINCYTPQELGRLIKD
jgi:hypothetical protein